MSRKSGVNLWGVLLLAALIALLFYMFELAPDEAKSATVAAPSAAAVQDLSCDKDYPKPGMVLATCTTDSADWFRASADGKGQYLARWTFTCQGLRRDSTIVTVEGRFVFRVDRANNEDLLALTKLASECQLTLRVWNSAGARPVQGLVAWSRDGEKTRYEAFIVP